VKDRRLERKTNTELQATSGFGGNWLTDRAGRENRVHGSDVGVIQQIGASRIECEATGMIFVTRLQREVPA
jgi:hypothetical protein